MEKCEKNYRIEKNDINEAYSTMVIYDADGNHVAEYRLTRGHEHTEIRDMRDDIDTHLANGGCLGNFNW